MLPQDTELLAVINTESDLFLHAEQGRFYYLVSREAPKNSQAFVNFVGSAIDHITQHGSMHTESIVTENITKARRFLREVDASSVMVNASTRFADGFEYVLGAEIGISTDKLHARGPVGLEGLTSQKYVVLGDGHIRV